MQMVENKYMSVERNADASMDNGSITECFDDYENVSRPS